MTEDKLKQRKKDNKRKPLKQDDQSINQMKNNHEEQNGAKSVLVRT